MEFMWNYTVKSSSVIYQNLHKSTGNFMLGIRLASVSQQLTKSILNVQGADFWFWRIYEKTTNSLFRWT
jgi:hypothetical protein